MNFEEHFNPNQAVRPMQSLVTDRDAERIVMSLELSIEPLMAVQSYYLDVWPGPRSEMLPLFLEDTLFLCKSMGAITSKWTPDGSSDVSLDQC